MTDAVKYVKEVLNLDKFKKFYYYENGNKRALILGAYEEQNISFSNTITSNPVEFGVNLSDTSFRNPIIIKAIILVSDSSSLIGQIVDTIGGTVIAGLQGNLLQSLKQQGIKLVDASSSGLLNSSKVYNKLITICQNFLSCEIITRDRIYTNLQITEINRKVAVDNDGGLAVEITLQEVMIFGDANRSNILGENPVQNGWTSPTTL